MTSYPRLCWLHNDGDEHWVPASDLVGLIRRVDGELRPDLLLGQAACPCAEALDEPARIVPLGALEVIQEVHR
jgi:hypothetical protein